MSLNVSLKSDSLNFNLDATPLSKIYLDVDNNLTLETDNEINYYSDSNIISIINEPFEVNSLLTLNIDSDGNQSLNFKTKNPKNYWGRLYLQNFIETNNLPEIKPWRGLVWSSEFNAFVGVSSSSTGTYNGVISTDGGNTWSSSLINVNDWRTLTYSPELLLFVAGGRGNGSGDEQFATSSDGVNWVYLNSPDDRNIGYIFWVPYLQLFVAISDDGGTNAIFTSPDGVAWTTTTIVADVWTSYAFSNELGIICIQSNNSTTGLYSYDAITWFTTTIPASNWRSGTWSPELNLFVICANAVGDPTMLSSDGISWTPGTLTIQNGWRIIEWISDIGLFVMATSNGGFDSIIVYSVDGINWTIKDQSSIITTRPFTLAWSPKYKQFLTLSSSTGVDQVLRNSV